MRKSLHWETSAFEEESTWNGEIVALRIINVFRGFSMKKSMHWETSSYLEDSARNEENNALMHKAHHYIRLTPYIAYLRMNWETSLHDELVKDGHESRIEDIGCIQPLRGDKEFLNLILIFFENWSCLPCPISCENNLGLFSWLYLEMIFL